MAVELVRLAEDITVYVGDCIEGMRQMAAGSVQCVVTSPPYWGLRDYGLPPSVWGGDPACEHEWEQRVVIRKGPSHGREGSTLASAGSAKTVGSGVTNNHGESKEFRADPHAFCTKCGAWLGCLGLEPTPELYVEHLVLVFREVRRILRDDGTVWLNLGDSYNGSGGAGGDYSPGGLKEGQPRYPGRKVGNLKPKDLCMIPERVALALQADGWWVRAKPPWLKGNAMPESVTDRPSTAHETFWLLTKSPTYFYDADAIRKPAQERGYPTWEERKAAGEPIRRGDPGRSGYTNRGEGMGANPSGRNRRTTDWWNESLDALIEWHRVEAALTDWHLARIAYLEHIREHGGMLLAEDGTPLGLMANPEPTSYAHFATFGRKQVEPCILAGTSQQACPHCGTPWVRVVERKHYGRWDDGTSNNNEQTKVHQKLGKTAGNNFYEQYEPPKTVGFRPTCSCDNNDGSGRCKVFDPFAGSGTTLRVAASLGRDGYGCELNPEYVDIMRKALSEAKRSQRTLQL